MKTNANLKIREAACNADVRLWEIAERIGVNDGNFSRKLRKELPEAEQRKILQIIDELVRERGA